MNERESKAWDDLMSQAHWKQSIIVRKPNTRGKTLCVGVVMCKAVAEAEENCYSRNKTARTRAPTRGRLSGDRSNSHMMKENPRLDTGMCSWGKSCLERKPFWKKIHIWGVNRGAMKR